MGALLARAISDASLWQAWEQVRDSTYFDGDPRGRDPGVSTAGWTAPWHADYQAVIWR
jgi:hypothetical protein